MIVFRRTQDDAVIGRINKTASGLSAEGMAESVLETARARGDNDQAIYAKYSSWSNGYFYSSEDRAAQRRATVKEAMSRG
jgi:hypothetical protein